MSERAFVSLGLYGLAVPGLMAEHVVWWGFALMGLLAGLVGGTLWRPREEA